MDNNQLDLGRIYGLTGCPEGGCVFTGEIIPNIPSLEQIAAVNYAQQYLRPTYASPELEQGVTELEQTLQAAQQRSTMEQAAREQASISGSAPPAGRTSAGTTPAMGSGMSATPGTTSAMGGGMAAAPGMTPALVSNEAAMNAGDMPIPSTMQQASNEFAPITEYNQPYPITSESIQYLNGFLRTQIGRRAEFQILVGTDNLVTKDGYLLGIGANYILINEIGTSDLTTCDFYNIKFVRFFYE